MTQPSTHEAMRSRTPRSAVDALLAEIALVEVNSVAIVDAAGLVLAESITADRPSPALDVSAMDGFAVRAVDVQADQLRVIGEARIGQPPPVLIPASCVRIATGSPLPQNADAVIKRELVQEFGEVIRLSDEARRVVAGQHVRHRGENQREGDLVVGPGSELLGSRLAAIASVGREHLQVYRRLRVSVLTTGDEVEPVGQSVSPWQVRNANGPGLVATISKLAWVEQCTQQHVLDEPTMLRNRVAQTLLSCDALILTGGVSMGHRDHVAEVLAAAGVRTIFHGVPQRPGKPILAGVTSDGRPVLALPGNPVSVLVTCVRFVLPALARRAGLLRHTSPSLMNVVNADDRVIDLWWHRPVALVGPGEVELIDTKSSGDVAAAARADGFIELPPGCTGRGPWAWYAW